MNATEPSTYQPLTYVEALEMAKAQYEETLVAVHTALDDALGRDHRQRDASAAAAIRRLAIDERARREMLQAQCQDARAALTAAGVGDGETLADGISELASRLADIRSARDARTLAAAR